MTERFRITDASIRLDSMPSDGRDLVLEVDAAEREAMAKLLGISAVERLAIKLHADKFSGGMRVTGKLTARVVQPSIVSLEPVTQDIEDAIDRVFLPGGEKSFAEAASAEVFVDLEGDDVPDHFDGTEADLSDLIIETLALNIDQYPRLEGESVANLGIDELNGAPESPFAKLKALKLNESGD